MTWVLRLPTRYDYSASTCKIFNMSQPMRLNAVALDHGSSEVLSLGDIALNEIIMICRWLQLNVDTVTAFYFSIPTSNPTSYPTRVRVWFGNPFLSEVGPYE